MRCRILYEYFNRKYKSLEEIDRWMISNKLKLNDDKTELIVFSSKFRPRPCLSNVQIGSECIEHSNTVRNLGVFGLIKLYLSGNM